jgi:CHAD domain-containing protein
MAYQFEKGETVSKGVVRIVTEEIDEALEQLRSADDRVKVVHESRKSIKKLRAILRIFEREMGSKAFSSENRFLRDTGRTLSDTRDADVLIESFDGIAKRLLDKENGQPQLITKTRKVVFAPQTEKNNHDPQVAIAEAIGRLEEAKKRVQDWPISDANQATITRGMSDIYRAGRRAMKTAYAQSQAEEQSEELFHDWRKRVKDLWYHTLLIQPTWPKLLDTYAGQAHKLADYLGEEHDLAILAATLHQHREKIGAKTFNYFDAEINERRENLKVKAHRLGHLLYAEKSSAYATRLERYWKISS